MADLVPIISIDLDKKRNLRFDLNAMITFEEISGKSIGEVLDNKQMDLKMLRALLFACLAWEDKELTLEDVGSFINLPKLGIISTQLRDGMARAMPQAKEGATPLKAVAKPRSKPSMKLVSTG